MHISWHTHPWTHCVIDEVFAPHELAQVREFVASDHSGTLNPAAGTYAATADLPAHIHSLFSQKKSRDLSQCVCGSLASHTRSTLEQTHVTAPVCESHRFCAGTTWVFISGAQPSSRQAIGVSGVCRIHWRWHSVV